MNAEIIKSLTEKERDLVLEYLFGRITAVGIELSKGGCIDDELQSIDELTRIAAAVRALALK